MHMHNERRKPPSNKKQREPLECRRSTVDNQMVEGGGDTFSSTSAVAKVYYHIAKLESVAHLKEGSVTGHAGMYVISLRSQVW
jgi:hypothetical protein